MKGFRIQNTCPSTIHFNSSQVARLLFLRMPRRALLPFLVPLLLALPLPVSTFPIHARGLGPTVIALIFGRHHFGVAAIVLCLVEGVVVVLLKLPFSILIYAEGAAHEEDAKQSNACNDDQPQRLTKYDFLGPHTGLSSRRCFRRLRFFLLLCVNLLRLCLLYYWLEWLLANSISAFYTLLALIPCDVACRLRAPAALAEVPARAAVSLPPAHPVTAGKPISGVAPLAVGARLRYLLLGAVRRAVVRRAVLLHAAL